MSAILADVVVVTYFSWMTAARELDEPAARARSERQANHFAAVGSL